MAAATYGIGTQNMFALLQDEDRQAAEPAKKDAAKRPEAKGAAGAAAAAKRPAGPAAAAAAPKEEHHAAGPRGVVRAGNRPPKREFDRHSGTGRGTEMKRGGAGKHNWGTANDEVIAAAEPSEAKDVAEAAPAAAAEGAAAAPVAEGEKPAGAAPAEPEDKEMTLEEYEAQQAAKLAKLALPKERKAGEGEKNGEPEGEALAPKEERGGDYFSKGEKKEKAKREKKAKEGRIDLKEFLAAAPAPHQGEGRGRGRGFRGGFRGGAAMGPRAARAPDVNDARSFPSLGAKQ